MKREVKTPSPRERVFLFDFSRGAPGSLSASIRRLGRRDRRAVENGPAGCSSEVARRSPPAGRTGAESGSSKPIAGKAVDSDLLSYRAIEKRRPCTYAGLSFRRSMKIVERSQRRRVHSCSETQPAQGGRSNATLGVCPSNRRQRRIRGCIRSRFGPRR